MTRPVALTRLGFSLVLLAVLIAGLTIGAVATQGVQAAPAPAQAAAPAAPPAPCGPNIAGDLGVNTADDSRCFELRMYTVDRSRDGVGNFKGGINELHQRFREGEVEVFERNGVDVLAVWQDLGESDTLVYLLAYKDRAARDAGWAAFGKDPEWDTLRRKYFVPLNSKVFYMSATDYSPMK
jgi:hypothetical protein